MAIYFVYFVYAKCLYCIRSKYILILHLRVGKIGLDYLYSKLKIAAVDAVKETFDELKEIIH